jgi:amino acid adenylation domain-containing protein
VHAALVLHEYLERAATAWPDRDAIRCRDRSLSYRELDRAAEAIAASLLDAGVMPGDRIGILIPKCVEAVAALYAALKVGAVYVPMDPKGPVKRAAMVANDCGIRALIGTHELSARLVDLLDSPPRLTIVIGEIDATHGSDVVAYSEIVERRAAGRVSAPVLEGDLAYILYTSGSTGVPKGVMLSHRNAMAFVDWCVEAMGLVADDRLSNHAPLHFDLSVFDLFAAAAVGASVTMVPEETAFLGTSLVRFIEDNAITVWYSVPSALRLIAESASGSELDALRVVVFAGEVYPKPQLRELRAQLPDAALWNLYGPTETNVCTFHRVPAELTDDDAPIPIGRAIRGDDVFAVSDDGGLAGSGEVGELLVRGATVMRGYWGRPDKTAEVLIPHPLLAEAAGLVYRTGDLVRLRSDGEYDFIGRRDHQVKSRGYRIELGEIEAAVTSHPGVEEVAVIGLPHEEWGVEIVAWVAPRPGATLNEMALKRHVADRVPRYMVPSTIAIADRLPKTSTGKVDRTALSRRPVGGDASRRSDPAAGSEGT